MLNHGAGEPCTIIINNTNILNSNDNNNENRKLNNISVSSLQGGIVRASAATHPMPEHCCLFIPLLHWPIGFNELLSPLGHHHQSRIAMISSVRW